MNWKDEDKKEVKEITSREMEDLRRELKAFPQKMIGTKLVSPFDQYCISLKVLRLDENGHMWCRDPEGHGRLSKTNAKLESREYYEQERVFQQFPEERQLFLKRLSDMRKKMTI